MDVWDDVDTIQRARRVVWDDDDWAGGIDLCLDHIGPFHDVPDGGLVVDVGCGMGRLLRPLARQWKNLRFVGLDPSARMLDYAASETADCPNVTLLQGGCGALPDDIWVAYSTVTMQHLPAVAQHEYIDVLVARLIPRGRISMQFVVDGEPAPLSNPIPLPELVPMFNQAGFIDIVVMPVERFRTWRWIAARTAR